MSYNCLLSCHYKHWGMEHQALADIGIRIEHPCPLRVSPVTVVRRMSFDGCMMKEARRHEHLDPNKLQQPPEITRVIVLTCWYE